MEYSQCQVIQEYVEALEKENQAKQAEQNTLYHHITTLEQELAQMEHYYLINCHLNQELTSLKQQLTNQQSKLNNIQEIEKMLEEKTQIIQKLQQSLQQKDLTIERQQQQLQMMDQRSCKLRESLQRQQSLSQQLKEINTLLIQKLKQHELQVKQWKTQKQKQNKQTAQFTEQEIFSLLAKYQILVKQCELQQQRQEQLEQQLIEYGFTVETKDNEIQSKNIRIKQLQSKLLFLQKKKDVQLASKCSSRPSISEVFTQPAFKLHRDKQIDVNNQYRYELMKENNSLLQNTANEAKTEFLQKSFLSQVESPWKRKPSRKLQLRNQLLKKQKQTLLKQLEI